MYCSKTGYRWEDFSSASHFLRHFNPSFLSLFDFAVVWIASLTDSIFNYFVLPQYGNFVSQTFANCLQTLLYISATGEQIMLDNGSKVNLQSKEGASALYWEVVNRGRSCLPPQMKLVELRIAAEKRKIAQHLLY